MKLDKRLLELNLKNVCASNLFNLRAIEGGSSQFEVLEKSAARYCANVKMLALIS